MNQQQSHFSLIVGPLVILLGLVGGVAGVWLAFSDPMALFITVVFFFLLIKGTLKVVK